MPGLGWTTVLLLATLGWDMAWYLIWLLPFVALVPNRRFRLVAGALLVWMTLQWLPYVPQAIQSALGATTSHTLVYCENQATMTKMLGRAQSRPRPPPRPPGAPVKGDVQAAGGQFSCASVRKARPSVSSSTPQGTLIQGEQAGAAGPLPAR